MRRTTIVAALAILTVLMAGAQAPSTNRQVFINNANATDYGYDLWEDVATEADYGSAHPWTHPSETDAWDTLVLDGSSTNFAYLAKDLRNLPQGSDKQSYMVAFRIMAQQGDGRTSGFAVAFSTEDTFSKGTGTEAGRTSGSFHNAVKVKFREDGNNWHLTLTEVVNGAESTLTTGRTDRSDQNRLFHFHVDNQADGGPRVELQDYAGQRILAADASVDFAGKAVASQWFVAYSHDGSDKAWTTVALNAPSTAIYDTHAQAPRVESVSFLPNPPGPNEPVLVKATVTDDWSVQRVLIIYRVNGGPGTQIDMTHQGGSLYEGTVPGQAADTSVILRLEATDDDGLVGHSDEEYAYVVGSGHAIGQDPNTEKPADPPGSGGVNEGRGLSGTHLFIAFLGVLVASLVAAFAFRQFGLKPGLSVIGSAVVVIGFFLAFQSSETFRRYWFNALAALAVPTILAGAWAWFDRQRRREAGRP